MKTPKEILLQRHQAVEFKLNAVRQKALATLEGRGQSWRGFLFSMRWHLAGLSAVWMAVFLLHLDSAPVSAVRMAQDKIPPARELFAALLKNRRELIELTEAPVNQPAALPPRRSEIQLPVEIV